MYDRPLYGKPLNRELMENSVCSGARARLLNPLRVICDLLLYGKHPD